MAPSILKVTASRTDCDLSSSSEQMRLLYACNWLKACILFTRWQLTHLINVSLKRKLLASEKCKPKIKERHCFLYVPWGYSLSKRVLIWLWWCSSWFTSKTETILPSCPFFMKYVTNLQSHCQLRHIGRWRITQVYHNGINLRKIGADFGGPEQRVFSWWLSSKESACNAGDMQKI